MKHFIIFVKYRVPFEKLGNNVAVHRTFLQSGYDDGMLLCSGPNEKKSAGVVVAKANDIEELKGFFKNDPYALKELADYEYLEFNPIKFQPFLQNWIES